GRAFRNEVRAVARLDHPGVVWVFDVGIVDAKAAADSGARLREGCPYIAMEHASRGTLRDWGGLPWEGVREVLLALLDALAHAHARGVIHRDIKPANVLLCGPQDLRAGLKLADFGIAHAVERNDQASGAQRAAVGTVQYMAPEQIRAETWEYGPWTDLYALGNVAWQLLTGQVPFQMYSGVALVRAQLEEQLPLPEANVPAGFDEWLRRCLAKEPSARFLRAADAASALLSLGEPTRSTRTPGPVLDVLPTVRLDLDEDGTSTAPIAAEPLPSELNPDTGLPEELELATGLVSLAMPVRVHAVSSRLRTGQVLTEIPEWRRLDTQRRSLQLLGAGLGLYGVRQPPLVGRIDERDMLWDCLRETARAQQPRLAVVTGAAGVGKSRLVRWLCERAHELGVAAPMRTRFFGEDAEDAPIRRMWARELRMAEVEPAARGRWLERVLALHDVEGSVESFAVLVGPGQAADRRERSEAMLRGMARERPVILWMDDVHVGMDGLLLAQHLLSASPGFPLLIVLTARSEALVDQHRERELLHSLGGAGLHLGPLPPRDHATLIEEVLGLSPALAAQVAERTGGNPLFAVQLIGDWVERGLLVLGPTGFEVRRGERAGLPAAMRDAWTDQVARVLEGLAPKSAPVLERAAALGLEVDEGEWQRACDDPDGSWAAVGRVRVVPENARLRETLVARLVEGRLAERTETGLRFAHGMIREALLERARASGRLSEHHLACAAILRHGPEAEGNAERLGRHLLEAGMHEPAVEPLLRGVVSRRDTAGARAALGLLATAEEAIRQLKLPQDDPRWGEAWQLRAMLCAELGEIAEAERIAARLFRFAEHLPGWELHALDARLTVARIQTSLGDLDGADRMFDDILARSPDESQRGLAHAERALIAARRGRAEDAKVHTAQAIRLLRRAASSRALAECWRLVGTTAQIAGNQRQAEDALLRGLKLYQRQGNIVGQADCLAGLGRTAADRDDLVLAEERFGEAIHLYEVAGSSNVVQPRSDLAALRLRAERFDEARDLLRAVLLTLGQQGRVGAVAGLCALQLAAAAGAGDWEDFDHRFGQLLTDPQAHHGPHSRWATELAIRLARRAGKSQRAERAAALIGHRAD
ncbi:MAG TPA: hypothetical protein ENK18_12955, partial [Deltaproteobacteria bacterium]|nr:hypothetical protein [Deltaproteobacteria bacterium]